MYGLRAVLMSSILGLLLIAGCGPSSDLPELAEATGYVTIDGKPLAGVLVLFAPEEGRGSHAYTDEDGYFELMYLPDTPGAIVGKHVVSISSAVEEEEEPDPRAKRFVDPIPAKYNTKTILTADVVADEHNEFKFDLESR